MLSPHAAVVQFGLHVDVSPAEPGSHCSYRRASEPALSRIPSRNARSDSAGTAEIAAARAVVGVDQVAVVAGLARIDHAVAAPLPLKQSGSHVRLARWRCRSQISFKSTTLLPRFVRLAVVRAAVDAAPAAANTGAVGVAVAGRAVVARAVELLPSSQTSSKSTIPFPHTCSDLQSLRAFVGNALLLLPGQSDPSFTAAVRPIALTVLPLSQLARIDVPLPQASFWQVCGSRRRP